MAQEELMPLLLKLVDRVEVMVDGQQRLESEMRAGFARVDENAARLEADMKAGFARVDAEMKAGFARVDENAARLEADMKAGFARVDGDMKQVKEMVGLTRTKEVARLDGRIDQLALDMSLLTRKHAAE